MGLHRGAFQHWKIYMENEMETGLYDALSCGDYVTGFITKVRSGGVYTKHE